MRRCSHCGRFAAYDAYGASWRCNGCGTTLPREGRPEQLHELPRTPATPIGRALARGHLYSVTVTVRPPA